MSLLKYGKIILCIISVLPEGTCCLHTTLMIIYNICSGAFWGWDASLKGIIVVVHGLPFKGFELSTFLLPFQTFDH